MINPERGIQRGIPARLLALGLLVASCSPAKPEPSPNAGISDSTITTESLNPTPTPEATVTPKPPEPAPTPTLRFPFYKVFSGFIFDEARNAAVGRIVIARIADSQKLLVKIARNDISCSDGTKQKDLGSSIYNLEAENNLNISNQARDLHIELRQNPSTGGLSIVGSLKMKTGLPYSTSSRECAPPPEVIFGAGEVGEGPEVIYREYADADNRVGENRTTPAIARGQIEVYNRGPLPPLP